LPTDLHKVITFINLYKGELWKITIEKSGILFSFKTPEKNEKNKTIRLNVNHDLIKLESFINQEFGEIVYKYLKEYNIFHVFSRKNPNIYALGIGNRKKDAHQLAILEYIERLAAASKPEKLITGSYSALKSCYKLLDPKILGVYDTEIALKNNLNPYHHSLEIEWVSANSLKENTAVLIPLQCAYYLVENVLNRYVFENSNGCALGNTTDEATLFALQEAVERIVFLDFWFNDGQSIKVNNHFLLRPYTLHMTYLKLFNFHLKFYNIKNKIGVYVIWCVIHDENYNSFTGLGSSFQAKKSMESSFKEAFGAFNEHKESFDNLEDMEFIDEPIDHIRFFHTSKGRNIIKNKILSNNTLKDEIIIDEEDPNIETNIEVQIDFLRKKILKCFEDIIILNLSDSKLSKVNLFCVKVIIIGAPLLDFTSNFIRVNGTVINDLNKHDVNNIHPLS